MVFSIAGFFFLHTNNQIGLRLLNYDIESETNRAVSILESSELPEASLRVTCFFSTFFTVGSCGFGVKDFVSN